MPVSLHCTPYGVSLFAWHAPAHLIVPELARVDREQFMLLFTPGLVELSFCALRDRVRPTFGGRIGEYARLHTPVAERRAYRI